VAGAVATSSGYTPVTGFVVTPLDGVGESGPGLSIFPGSASPAIFSASAPFWIGCGFVAGPEGREAGVELDSQTRFELEVDDQPVAVTMAATAEDGRTISRTCVATFPAGLPAGWHRFSGRWYDGSRLVLTSVRSIEFVER
jgi:hypothetical protein